MVAYNFKGRFIEPIRLGTMRQTIRAVGKKRHARHGERMTMTSGDRFHPKAIGEGICTLVRPITLNFNVRTPGGRPLAPHVVIGSPGDAIVLRRDERYSDGLSLDAFAVSDGFVDWDDLTEFWQQTHPLELNAAPLLDFTGLCIEWSDFREPTP